MRAKIFFIDDEPEILLMLTEFFTRLNYFCKGVCTGVNSVNEIKKFKPDLIISDFHIGSECGLDVLKAVKQSKELAAIPFIILSSDSQKQNITKALSLGAAAYLNKPVDFKYLKEFTDIIINCSCINEAHTKQSLLNHQSQAASFSLSLPVY